MRILDKKEDKSLSTIILCLRIDEARNLYDSLKDLIDNPKNNHAHIPSRDYNKEITVCIYDEDNVDNSFSQRIVRLIKEDM